MIQANEVIITNELEKHCLHCGDPLASAQNEKDAFCCLGCKVVYSTLNELDLQHFYYLQKESGLSLKRRDRLTNQELFKLFDHQQFVDNYVRNVDGEISKIVFFLEGIHCTACIWLIEKLPFILSGVQSARVDFARSSVEVQFNHSAVKISAIAKQLYDLGYDPHPMRSDGSEDKNVKEDRKLLVRMGVAGVSAANCMMLAVSIYSGFISLEDQKYLLFFDLVSLLLAIPAVTYSALPFYRASLAGLKQGQVHIDLPLSLAILVAFSVSAYNSFLGSAEVYFDSLTTLIFLLLSARYVQRRALRKAYHKTRLVLTLFPATARKLVANREVVVVPTTSLIVGDIVEVPAGEVFPADGEILSGYTAVDISILTGESKLLPREPKEEVFAGTLNVSSPVQIELRATNQQTRLGKLACAIEEAVAKRAPIVEFADRVSQRLMIIVLLLAGITFSYWLPLGIQPALNNFFSFLIVTCPCALGIGAPLAIASAVGKAAGCGIIIKGGDALERLATVKRVYFDKTGTLTESELDFKESWWSDNESKDEMTTALAILEASVPSHPVSRAVLRVLENNFSGGEQAVEFIPGRGIKWRDVSGIDWAVGSVEWITGFSRVPNVCSDKLKVWQQDGYTLAVLAKNKQVVAAFSFASRIREGAAETIAALEKSGREVYILSGDTVEAVYSVAKSLNISKEQAMGGFSPEDKLEIVKASELPAAMIGDGVNDGPAIAASLVGIGLRGGAEVCLEVADVFVSRDSLSLIRACFAGADRTFRIIKRNFVISAFYNIIGGSLAVCGAITPLIAAILMPLSSLTVVISSLSGTSFKDER